MEYLSYHPYKILTLRNIKGVGSAGDADMVLKVVHTLEWNEQVFFTIKHDTETKPR